MLFLQPTQALEFREVESRRQDERAVFSESIEDTRGAILEFSRILEGETRAADLHVALWRFSPNIIVMMYLH